MVSNIDETKPVTGIDQPVQVIRDNFGFAKIEIEALQSSKVDRNGDTMLGVLQFASITLASLPDPTATPGGMLFVTDGSPIAPFYSDGTSWISVVDPINLFTELSQDLTPQLGGSLDLNGWDIIEGTIFKWDGTNARLSLNTDVQTIDISGSTFGSRLNTTRGSAPEEIGFSSGSHNDTAKSGPSMLGYRSRGTEAAPTIVQSGDELLEISGLGYDGTDYATAAKIIMQIDGTPGTDDMPGRILFSVSPDGSEIAGEVLRIESDGTLSVQGTTNYENLVVDDDDIPNKKYVDDNEYATKNFAENGDSFVINSKHQLIVYQEYIVETGGTLTIEPNAAMVIL